jgi:hypothetical protein
MENHIRVIWTHKFFPIAQIYKLFLGISYVFLMFYVHCEQALRICSKITRGVNIQGFLLLHVKCLCSKIHYIPGIARSNEILGWEGF